MTVAFRETYFHFVDVISVISTAVLVIALFWRMCRPFPRLYLALLISQIVQLLSGPFIELFKMSPLVDSMTAALATVGVCLIAISLRAGPPPLNKH